MIYIILACFLLNTFSLGWVSNYGEVCNHTDECSDHRYNCLADDENVTRCLCDRFHMWMGVNFGCIQMFNASYIINQTVTITDNIKILEKERDENFHGQAVAGIFMLSMIILATLSVCFYCIHMAHSDSKLYNSLINAKKKQSKMRPSAIV